MYLDYWNLREAPFQNIADPRFAYLCDQHHEGLARLVYLVQNRKLGGVLTGPYGVGKSMVLELLGHQLRSEKSVRYIGIDYLPGSTLSFARHLLRLMGFEEAATKILEPMDAVSYLREHQNKLSHCALTIDEAQCIQNPEVYHFLHLLMNLSLLGKDGSPVAPAFTLILAGYSDMTKLLSQDESLCQRLQMVWKLEPLNSRQILEYVQHRIRVAGGDIWLFDREAIDVLEKTRGIPRIINNVCDVALMLGFAANVRSIHAKLMRQALEEASVFSKHLAADGGTAT